jgi:hypothetical protein
MRLEEFDEACAVDAGEEKWYSVNDAFLRASIRAWGGVS